MSSATVTSDSAGHLVDRPRRIRASSSRSSTWASPRCAASSRSSRGTIESDGERASVTGNVDASSLTTHNAQRDEHLNSNDFFGVEEHPQITFRADRSS